MLAKFTGYSSFGLIIGIVSAISLNIGRAENAEDSIGKKFTFGFRLEGEEGNYKGGKKFDLFICDPVFKSINQFSYEELSREFTREYDEYRDTFIPLKDSFVSDISEDYSGDTVLTVCSSGKYKAVIEEIGFYETVCASGLACRLHFVEEPTILPGLMEPFIVYRSGSFYPGPLIPFEEVAVSDPNFTAIEDSIRQLISQSWLADSMASCGSDAQKPNPDSILSQCEGIERIYKSSIEDNPDTLFLSANCNLGYESDWSAVYQITKSGDLWEFVPIEKPDRGQYSTEILFALDFDGDGALEYFVQKIYYEGLSAGIYRLAAGGWTPIFVYNYGGC